MAGWLWKSRRRGGSQPDVFLAKWFLFLFCFVFRCWRHLSIVGVMMAPGPADSAVANHDSCGHMALVQPSSLGQCLAGFSRSAYFGLSLVYLPLDFSSSWPQFKDGTLFKGGMPPVVLRLMWLPIIPLATERSLRVQQAHSPQLGPSIPTVLPLLATRGSGHHTPFTGSGSSL